MDLEREINVIFELYVFRKKTVRHSFSIFFKLLYKIII